MISSLVVSNKTELQVLDDYEPKDVQLLFRWAVS